MPATADGIYDHRPWQPQFKRPGATYEDALTAEALQAAMDEPADSIRARRPNIAIELFPPRFGYRQEALGISDIVRLDDIYRRVDYSARQSGYSGTSYPSLNQF